MEILASLSDSMNSFKSVLSDCLIQYSEISEKSYDQKGNEKKSNTVLKCKLSKTTTPMNVEFSKTYNDMIVKVDICFPGADETKQKSIIELGQLLSTMQGVVYTPVVEIDDPDVYIRFMMSVISKYQVSCLLCVLSQFPHVVMDTSGVL
jgi:hypothetical protein